MSNQIRQGDVFLIRVSSLPPGATREKAADSDIVLAHGEATGHAHRVSAAHASMYAWQGDRLIEVKKDTDLTHEEHGALRLSPGIYKVVIQREYSPGFFSQIVD